MRITLAGGSRLTSSANANWFRNLIDDRAKIAAWRDEYNGERPTAVWVTARPMSSRLTQTP